MRNSIVEKLITFVIDFKKNKMKIALLFLAKIKFFYLFPFELNNSSQNIQKELEFSQRALN